MKSTKQVIVVGGGLAGLSCTMKLAEMGVKVILVSVTKVKRSHSVCAQGGINAAMNTRGEGDSPLNHAFETIKGADFLVDQPPVVEMCLTAPSIIRLLDRLGCPFNRTPEGNLDFRGFGGTLYHRTAFCDGSTGQQLLYTLDEQVRRYEVKGLVHKLENHEFMRLVRDEKEGRACGIVLQDLFNLKLETLKGDAVVLATGGPGLIFRRTTNSTFCSGAANGRAFKQGMLYANGEFIQIHPTAIPGEDKLRLVSEGVRGQGGRAWVYGDSNKQIRTPDGGTIPCGKTGEPWYFFEELYPAYGNVVPRDIAARVVMQVCSLGLGIDGGNQVYLDVTHLPEKTHRDLGAILEIYEKFTGEDPRKTPMRVYPGVHYSMGGAYVDWPASDAPDRNDRYRQMTNLTGLFNVGESDFQYHGANRLGANSLMSCIFGGLVTAKDIHRYLESTSFHHEEVSESTYDHELSIEEAAKEKLMSAEGEENAYVLHDELGEEMLAKCTVWRENEELEKLILKIGEIRERATRIALADHGRFANQSYIFSRQFTDGMIDLAEVIAVGALARNESRGAHYKAAFPERDDPNWLKITLAEYRKGELPHLTYRPPEMPYLDPLPRDYAHKKKVAPAFHDLPEHFDLPV